MRYVNLGKSGARRVKYAEDNARSADLELTASERTRINSILATEQIAGSRDWVTVARGQS